MATIRNKQYDITARQTIQTVPIIVRQKQSTSIPVRRVLDFRPLAIRQQELLPQVAVKTTRRFSSLIGMFVLLLAIVSSSIGGTASFYNDDEIAPDNVFTAGLVDFVLTDTPFASAASTTDWTVDVTPHEASNPFYYYASSTDLMGNSELCNALTVAATLDGQVMFDGLLRDMVTGTTTVISAWTFDFNDFESYVGQSCSFYVEYNSWQTRHGIDQGGYSDTERVMYSITVPSLLLGKVYFADVACTADVASTTNCNDTQTWVELYNRTDTDIDTAGWSLCSANSCFQIMDSQYIDTTIIKAGEFGIVAADPDIHTQISLPWGVTPLITDGVWFAADLDPAGGMLQLRDSDNLLIDQLNWGVSSTTWTNYTSLLWTDNSLIATSTHALGRWPVDSDSNQPADWMLLGVPTLTIDAIEPAVLTVGEEVVITYTAVNTNGLSEDLRLDWYLFEEDDTLHVIELDVENTGEYSFVVPDSLDGPIRIKPVATSPENILLNARALTDELLYVDESSNGQSQPVEIQVESAELIETVVSDESFAFASSSATTTPTASTTVTATVSSSTEQALILEELILTIEEVNTASGTVEVATDIEIETESATTSGVVEIQAEEEEVIQSEEPVAELDQIEVASEEGVLEEAEIVEEAAL